MSGPPSPASVNAIAAATCYAALEHLTASEQVAVLAYLAFVLRADAAAIGEAIDQLLEAINACA